MVYLIVLLAVALLVGLMLMAQPRVKQAPVRLVVSRRRARRR